MKKSIIASFIAIVLLSACKETETTTVDITGTATIRGTVSADFEKVNTPFVSEALDSVLVRILWSSADLAVISDGDVRTESITVRTNSNGEYSVEVPTTEAGVTFTIEFDEFTQEVSYNNGVTTATETVVFSSASTTVSVEIGETVTVDQDYEDNFKGGVVLDEFGTITGVVEADTEQINTEEIPELAGSVNVTVKWTDNDGNEKSLATTTDENGVYSIQVPTNDVDGDDFTVVFEEYTTTVNYNDGFRDVTDFSATFNDTEFASIAVSAGEEVTRNYNYDNDFKDALPTFGIITGSVEARVNNIAGMEDTDSIANVQIRIVWTDGEGNTRGLFTTTNSEGVYSTEVPLAASDDFRVRVLEFTVSGYQFTNDDAMDVTGTATYGESADSNVNNVAKGSERTQNFGPYTTPDTETEN